MAQWDFHADLTGLLLGPELDYTVAVQALGK